MCCYFYPTTRDEFYYLDGMIDVFGEYYNSYLRVNARIGQFFCNLAGRSKFFEQLTGIFIFLGFFYTFYLNIFQNKPKFSLLDGSKMIVTSAVFIFLISYFGEMFFYVPFSTNYTLTNVFYLLYVFILTQTFVYKRDILKEKKVPLLVLFVFGFFIGMGNEHVPPVLIAVTGLQFLIEMIKAKKIYFFSKKLLITSVGILLGYLVLFLAPANKVRFSREGKKELGFNLADYIGNFKQITKLYYHYNFELILALGVFFVLLLVLFCKKKLKDNFIYELSSYFLMGFLGIMITAYSPIVGTRLLFFSNVLMIISILITIFRISDVLMKKKMLQNVLTAVCSVYILFYFSASLYICIKADENFNKIISQIDQKSKETKYVIISDGFNYNSDFFGNFNRKVLLDSGESYIDQDPVKKSPVEKNILRFYHINSIKTQNAEK
nr:DUF6056 family protein [Chryseobacterium sp.]